MKGRIKKLIDELIDAGHICNGCGKDPAVLSCREAGYRMCHECHSEYHAEAEEGKPE